MTLFRLLNLRRFTEHRTRTALSLSGIAIGSALLVAVLGLLGSLTGSVRGFVEDLAGLADLEVSAVTNEGFDETVFFDVENQPGVEAAIPMIRTRALVNRTPIVFLGVDQRAEALSSEVLRGQRGVFMRLASRPGILIGSGLARQVDAREGDRVTVFSTGGEVEVEVLGILEGEAARFSNGMFALSAIPVAQQVLGKGPRIDSVFVVAEGGA
ncbi:MAG: ABC transporter permease, partial [Actinomycetota bacterium]|nr:ABC transporter permease [Actinomycetota bacterium]